MKIDLLMHVVGHDGFVGKHVVINNVHGSGIVAIVYVQSKTVKRE